MGKMISNPATGELRGRVGNLVFVKHKPSPSLCGGQFSHRAEYGPHAIPAAFPLDSRSIRALDPRNIGHGAGPPTRVVVAEPNWTTVQIYRI
jgi:hypothetical protein